jgi:hypothetical protein
MELVMSLKLKLGQSAFQRSAPSVQRVPLSNLEAEPIDINQRRSMPLCILATPLGWEPPGGRSVRMQEEVKRAPYGQGTPPKHHRKIEPLTVKEAQ